MITDISTWNTAQLHLRLQQLKPGSEESIRIHKELGRRLTDPVILKPPR